MISGEQVILGNSWKIRIPAHLRYSQGKNSKVNDTLPTVQVLVTVHEGERY